LPKPTTCLKASPEQKAGIKPRPGKWSYKEIIGHLIDSASNNHQKFLRTASEPGLQFPGYEQDDWVSAQRYNERPWMELLDLWYGYNLHLAHVMEYLPEDRSSNSIFINGKGPFTLDYIVNDYTEHLKHHLKAILPMVDFLENQFRSVY
jgi:hypothetical protein